MKPLFLFLAAIMPGVYCFSQNVGIGTITPTERLHVAGNRVLLDVNYVGIGSGAPVTGASYFQINNPINSYVGMYCNSGPTGLPFYGYALNGTARAYHQFNGNTNAYEYYQSNGAVPDYYISGNTKAVFNTAFVGVGTSTPTTGFTGLALKSSANSFWGMYVDAGPTGQPFYGYALNGNPVAFHQFNATNSALEYYQSNNSIPDFLINGNVKAVFNTGFLGIGASTPTTGFTGLSLKSGANNYWGMYVDAGTTGLPFYGYALNGNPRAFHQFNGTSNAFEYYQSNNSVPDFLINSNTKAVFNTAFVGIGTSTPTTGFTGFAMKSNVNSFYGSYIDAGPLGVPFYGYALNGSARAYGAFNGTNNAYEYHQTSDAIPDFLVNGNVKAVFNTAFVGIGTSTPTTGFTGFAMKSNVNSFYGSYIDAGPSGVPFYGYALNGSPVAYTTYNGGTNQFEYHHTSDVTPDFAVSNTQALFPIQTFLGLGTSTPTTGAATGFTMKKNTNGFYGMYIDAGATGEPFYGFALNGNGIAWTEIDGGNNNNWELNYGGVRMTVTSAGLVGIGTTAPSQKLDVSGTIHASNLNGGATSLSTNAAGDIIRTPSDANLKYNINDIDNPLEKIKAMHGVTYHFKDSDRFGTQRQMGFIAQELEKVVPDAVSSGGEYKSVNYQVLTALLTEAVKEQQKQIDIQQKDKAILINKIDELSKRIEALELKGKDN